ncbi:MAG: hypothetical protein J6Q27_03560 [Clostridia bacterium]|nr:hypothetical protein [Clostridia bacterium]
MDIFCEFLVKKKSVADNLKKAALILACIAVCLTIVYVGFFLYRGMVPLIPILVAATIYGTVIYSRNFSLEYEYIFTNGVLDIDVIKGRATRKQLISVSCRKIEYMGPVTGVKPSQNAVVNAMYDESRPGKYVITFSNGGQKTDLYLQPPEKLLLNMQKYNPRNIHI